MILITDVISQSSNFCVIVLDETTYYITAFAVDSNNVVIWTQQTSITTDFGWHPSANTLLYYNFDNDTASISYDGSGNSYNGTWNNNSGTYQSLTKGKCVELTGASGKYMRMPSSIPFTTTNFTFSFLVKFTQNTTDTRCIFSKMQGSGMANYLYIYQQNGKIGADIPWGYNNIFLSNNTLNDNKWHYITMVKNGTNYKMYVDSVLNSNITQSSASPQQSTNNGGFIGVNAVSLQNQYAGLLDEFICETVSWSQQDITKYFNKIKTIYSIS